MNRDSSTYRKRNLGQTVRFAGSLKIFACFRVFRFFARKIAGSDSAADHAKSQIPWVRQLVDSHGEYPVPVVSCLFLVVARGVVPKISSQLPKFEFKFTPRHFSSCLESANWIWRFWTDAPPLPWDQYIFVVEHRHRLRALLRQHATSILRKKEKGTRIHQLLGLKNNFFSFLDRNFRFH